MSAPTTIDRASLDSWYVIGSERRLPEGDSRTRLLGRDIAIRRDGDAFDVTADGVPLRLSLAHGYVWASLGEPARPLFELPEALEDDRRIVDCGTITVRASALRIVENFLDMAHFPFVHTDILGSEPYTEVKHYKAEIRRDADEVWATDCEFFQPQAALSATGGITTRYVYRVMTPTATLLYKTSPNSDTRMDVICLFVQPLADDLCAAHPIMFLIDDASPEAALVGFQQMIFMQDRIILENQRPRLLPLEARAEIPTRADASSIAYRRWLKEKGVTYGTTLAAG